MQNQIVSMTIDLLKKVTEENNKTARREYSVCISKLNDVLKWLTKAELSKTQQVVDVEVEPDPVAFVAEQKLPTDTKKLKTKNKAW